MNVIYASEKIELIGKSVFLAGPTPRIKEVKSWRPYAVAMLKSIGFTGTVLIPENRDGETKYDYVSQVEWEWEGLENCSVIAFWVPRELKLMPAFTTNVEFGSYVRSGRAFYGRPDWSPKNNYLDWLYEKVTNRKPHSDLLSLLREIVSGMNNSKL